MTEKNGFPTGDELRERVESEPDDVEWDDKYDDVPRYSELSEEEQNEEFDLAQDFTLAAGLSNGAVPREGMTITKQCEGDTKAEALGKAYLTRDRIQENGGECDVEYIGPHLIRGAKLYHEIEITVTHRPTED